MANSFPSAEARLATLAAFPISPDERETLIQQFEQLSRAVEALAAAVAQDVEPATGFDPLLGGTHER